MDEDSKRHAADPEASKAGSQRELKDALERLETAVQDLANTARDDLSDWTSRATAFIDEASERLERQTSSRRERAQSQSEQSAPVDDVSERRAYGFTRDRSRGKIMGVCAGLARYWNMEPWMVRCMAITALLFFPGLAFPAYFIAGFVLDDGGSEPGRRRSRGRRRRSSRRSRKHARGSSRQSVSAEEVEESVELPPRAQFKNVQSVMAQAELRLRRMESHVTSGSYELHKALHELDREETSKAST